MINLTQEIFPIIGYAFIISMIINSVNVCFWEGHIFEKIGDKMEDYKIWKPIAGCIICMAPWWGAALCYGFGWPVFSIITAMGMNVLIVRMSPKDEIDVINHYKNMDQETEKEVLRRIKEYSHKAEAFAECKTPEDEKTLDLLLAKAEALQDLMRWVKRY